MNVTITWHGDNFNVDLSNKGKESFLSIKGCRIVQGKDGDFVSYPARKNEQTGKWWNHVWGSNEFNAVVLEKAKAGQPQQGQSRRSAPDDDIPF
jgi:hypothetical protein